VKSVVYSLLPGITVALNEIILDLRQRGRMQAGERRGFALELLAQLLLVFVEEGLFDRDLDVAQVDGFRESAREGAGAPI
jgi:hypothetical protein